MNIKNLRIKKITPIVILGYIIILFSTAGFLGGLIVLFKQFLLITSLIIISIIILFSLAGVINDFFIEREERNY